MQFAQFVDHDLTFTPMNQGPLGLVLNCKDCESGLTVHPECFPIHIPKNDPFYSAVNLNTGQANCISSVRSLPGQLKLVKIWFYNREGASCSGRVCCTVASKKLVHIECSTE
ncbi:eosinophil peroxidase-like isoform X2 [Tachypleus tridentatus]|uniref:eosinophil peroxidase-like isoform X2 n=1 Tax=Tachypleus tridentatus TaxID=6853 RepID=UPI003FCF09FF